MHLKAAIRRFALYLLLGVLTIPAAAQAAPLNGLYCYKATIEFSGPLEADGKCYPPMKKVEGLQTCRGTAQNSQALQLRENADGTLDFGVSVWQDGFNCGVSGKAVKKDKGWRLEKFINDPEEYGRCRLDITVSADNMLTLRTDPKAACRYACGAGIGLDGVKFPLNSSRVGPAKDEIFQSEEYIYTQPVCP